jgi:hypothetical protein
MANLNTKTDCKQDREEEYLRRMHEAACVHDATKGMRKKVRAQWHPEIMRPAYDPDELDPCSPRAPPEVQVAFEELVGKEPRFKLRLHPLFKRWCGWERVPVNGTSDKYVPFLLCQDEPLDDEGIPSDYRDRPDLWHLGGIIGEYRLPTRQDFVDVLKFDRWRYRTDEIEEHLDAHQVQQEKDAACTREAQLHDICSYTFEAIRDTENQRAGSGQRLSSYDTIEIRPDGARYAHYQAEGYKVVVRRGSRAEEKIIESGTRKVADEAARLDRIEADAARRLTLRRAREAISVLERRRGARSL